MIRAGRSFEHPGRNLQAAIRVRSARRAAENDPIGLLDRFMNGHLKPKPRVPRIQKLPKRGPVGVLKPCSTITGGCTRRWDISARWPSRKSGLPAKRGSPHNRSAMGDAKRGQGHLAWVGVRRTHRICRHRDAPFPSYSIGHATSERATPLMRSAAAEVRRSFEESPRTRFLERRPPPSGTRRSGRDRRPSRLS